MTLPDDHSGIIAGFNATVRFLKWLVWPALFVTLALILILTNARSTP
jgi:hypothetical protein